MATSLECRLICASNTAAHIRQDGPVPQQQPYYDAAGFIDQPPGFVDADKQINACLVASTTDGVVLAFRGTLLPSPDPNSPDNPPFEQVIRDLLNDLKIELVRGGNLPGLVHAGFWGSLDSLWSRLVPEVRTRLAQAGSGTQLYVTGQSKGGALANLAAMRLLIETGITGKVYTYAAAHPGNEDFAAVYDQHIDSTRYEYADDIGPHLPPSRRFRSMFATVPFLAPYLQRSDRDYAPVGTLRYITREKTIVPDSPLLAFERYLSLATLLNTGKFERIAKDHIGECGGGYMDAVCPEGVCPPRSACSRPLEAPGHDHRESTT